MLPELPQVSTAAFSPHVREQIDAAFAEARARPRDAAATGRLGMALHAHKQFDAARQCYLRASAMEPKRFEWKYYLGVVSQGTGAVDAFRAALKLRDDVAARIKLGEALLAAGDDSEARDVFRGIDHPVAWFGYARATGDASYYEKAVAAFPRYGAALFALAQAYQRAGRAADAQRLMAEYALSKTIVPPLEDPLMDAVEALNRGPERLLREAANLEAQGQLQPAIETELSALALDPKLVEAHVQLIALYGRAGKPAEAEQHYREAVALNPRSAAAHYNFGVFCYGAKRRDEARRAFEAALAIDPSHAEAHNNLGAILEEDGRLDAAAREFQKALDSRPDYSLARFHLGRIYANQSRWRDAIEQLRRAAESDDEGAATYTYALGATEARAGRREQAVATLNAARQKALARGQAPLAAAIERDLARLRP